VSIYPKFSYAADHVCSENIVKWDMAETAKGGPFDELLNGTLNHNNDAQIVY